MKPLDPHEPIRLMNPYRALSATAPRDLVIAVLIAAIIAVLAAAAGVWS